MLSMTVYRCAALTALAALALSGAPHPASAQPPSSEIDALRREVQELRKRDAETRQKLEALQRQLEHLQASAPPPAGGPPVAEPAPAAAPAAPPPAAVAAPPAPSPAASAALDKAVAALGTPSAAPATEVWSRPLGPAQLRLIDIGFDIMSAGGSSTATDSELHDLQGGAHDPNRRGFTLQQGELSLRGAVDPYFSGAAYVIFNDSDVELEEAYLTTNALPYGLQAKAGYYLTEFGRINPLHPHAWDWIDQPVIVTRLMSGDGLRSPGARLSWLTPLPWFSQVYAGIQNANQGETTPSFIGDTGIGDWPTVSRPVANLGDMLYFARWENFATVSDTVGAKIGVSGLYGPNNAGPDADTWIYGADLDLRWRPVNNFRGWPFAVWHTEVMKRDYSTGAYSPPPSTTAGDNGGNAGSAPLGATILRDYGFYTEALYGFRYGWASGLRYEYVTGHNNGAIPRSQDPFRDSRHRVSPLLMWQPTEFSRFRLQYNYDNATHLPDVSAHTVWLGAEILYGAHAAHTY